MTAKARSTSASRAPKPGLSLSEVMATLEQAGTEQTRKTWRRHGAAEPMFGVLFSVMKPLRKRIGVDHELALALWDTGNYDARTLAAKVADPRRLTPSDLDRLAATPNARALHYLIALLAVDGTHGRSRAEAWLAAPDEQRRSIAWSVVSGLALRDEDIPDAWFEERLRTIESTIHSAPNGQRYAMNQALIAIGCRNARLREPARAAAVRIGAVEIDHGDTCCETPDAGPYIDKTWAHATSKGFSDPGAQERSRETVRTRC